MRRSPWALSVLLLLAACSKSEPAPTATPPAPVASLSVTTGASAAPPVATPTPSASAAKDPEDESCFSPAKSQDYAKPRKNAAPPYEECAAGIFSHCEPDQSYCSIALDVARTKKKRASGHELCCYGR